MKPISDFKAVFSVFFCAVFFFTASAVYLNYKLDYAEKTAKDAQKIPYETTPENKTICFEDINGHCFSLLLDFSKKSITFSALKAKVPADFHIKEREGFLEGLINYLGGIELKTGYKTYRLTGIQTVEFLSENPNDKKLKKTVINEIFDTISKNGFSNEGFVYIIENTDTDLKLPDCILWLDYIGEICKKTEVIL